MRVLHAFASSVLDPRHKFLGTTKDVRGRTQYFEARGIERRELVIAARKERCFLRALDGVDLADLDAVIVEGTYFPGAISSIKDACPGLRVFARGVNAELLHWLHSARAALRHDSWKRLLFDLEGALVFGLKDLRCAVAADAILPISEWESRWYWSLLAPRDRVTTMPYFLPDSYVNDIPPARAKEHRLVCMMTTRADRPFHVDAARNLCRLVNALGGELPEWRFSITGDFQAERLPPCPRLEVAGFLENPLELLAASRGVALLSDYGFGFKTKLLEAICCGCYILVPKGLHARLPVEVRRHAIVVDVDSPRSFREALARCAEPFPAGDPNAALRAEAYAALDRVLGVSAPGASAVENELAVRYSSPGNFPRE
jgi:glycosyltransferase involved in cell wall biosynthesis